MAPARLPRPLLASNLVAAAAAEPGARVDRVPAIRAPAIHINHRVPFGCPKQARPSSERSPSERPDGHERGGAAKCGTAKRGARTRCEENSIAMRASRGPALKECVG